MIDGHVHFWRLSRRVNTALSPDMTAIYRDVEPGELLPILQESGLRAAIAVQASETLGENLYMAGLARQHAWIAGVVGWVDPGSPSIGEELAALCVLGGIVGVRPVRDDNLTIRWMVEPVLQTGWSKIAASGLAIDILVQDWNELDIVRAMIEAYPDARFVLDHCGKPDIPGGHFDAWAAHIERIARQRNAFCKFSGLAAGVDPETVKPFADQVIRCFGPDRLIWCSDWPPLDLVSSYGGWVDLTRVLTQGLTDEGRAAIWYRTAERVYGVSLPRDAGEPPA
ncbi:MAG: amidohydrolase family protein [Albidovulum sp.]|nr:amidohydrolase family protein [Albidovulum sp.]